MTHAPTCEQCGIACLDGPVCGECRRRRSLPFEFGLTPCAGHALAVALEAIAQVPKHHKLDPGRAVESATWCFVPCLHIGTSGYVFRKRDGLVAAVGSGLAKRELWQALLSDESHPFFFTPG